MSDFRQKYADFKASKSVLLWSCAGVSILTMVVGFTWGGWVTSGSAADQSEAAVETAVAELASDVCFARFMGAPEVRANYAALMEESTYSRNNSLEDGGWATIEGREDPVDGAADLCADRIAEAELPAEALPPAAASLAGESETDVDVPVADAEGVEADEPLAN